MVKPKASLPFWLPAMDWKIISAGAPRLIASSWVVMCPRTQIWVGISNWFFTSSNRFRISERLDTVSPEGFSPMRASPQP